MSRSNTGFTAQQAGWTRRRVLQTTVGAGIVGVVGSSSAGAADDSTDENDHPAGHADLSLRFRPSTNTVDAASKGVYDLVVSGAEDGIAAYECHIESTDPAVAAITEIEPVAFGGRFSSIDLADDGTTAVIEEATGDSSAPGATFTIVRVTVTAGETAGTAELRVAGDARVQSTADYFYQVDTSDSATVEVDADGEIQATTTDTAGQTQAESEHNEPGAQTADRTPGFGVLSTMAALGSIGYAVRRLRHPSRDT